MGGLIEFLKYILRIKDKYDITNISDEEKKEIMKFYEKFKEKQKEENKENYILVNTINPS